MRTVLITICLLLAGFQGAARAAVIADAPGDFLSTYTGPHDAGLDVVAHEVTLVGDRLNFFARMDGPIAPTQAIGGVYLIGLNRGPGTARFNNVPPAPPVIGPNVLFDSILRVNPNGTGQFSNLVGGGTTALDPADINISGDEFTASIPVSLMMASATLPAELWTYNLWPRNGVGSNVQVSDLAPDDGNSPVQVVPEPGSLTFCGIGALGLLVYRRPRKSHPSALCAQGRRTSPRMCRC